MRMMKYGAVACVSILSGCSVFGVGSNDFSCPGMPKGIVCKSTGEIYELTGENNLQALVGDPVDMTVHKWFRTMTLMGRLLSGRRKILITTCSTNPW